VQTRLTKPDLICQRLAPILRAGPGYYYGREIRDQETAETALQAARRPFGFFFHAAHHECRRLASRFSTWALSFCRPLPRFPPYSPSAWSAGCAKNAKSRGAFAHGFLEKIQYILKQIPKVAKVELPKELVFTIRRLPGVPQLGYSGRGH